MRGRAGLLSIAVIPVLALSLGFLGRSTFWYVSEGFPAQVPLYFLALVVIELVCYAATRWAYPRLTLGAGAPGNTLASWGASQLAGGVVAIQLFPDQDLWLGSTVLVYVGLAAVILWVFERTGSASGHS